MSEQQEEADRESVSSSASCAQVDGAFVSTPWTWTSPDEVDEHLPAYSQAAVWDNIGDLVCAVTTQMNGDGSMEAASDRARLIAAAPNLLSAAKRMLSAVQSSDPSEPGTQRPDSGAVMSLKGAIAKAEGEE
jgi:hypothetical protein